MTTDRQYRQMMDPLARIDDRLGRIQAGQGPMGRLLREDGQYTYYVNQAAGLRRTVADLRTQEFLTSDSLYNGWNQAVLSLIRQVDDINTSAMFRNSLDYDNATGAMRELRETVRDFRQNPKKYLRFQLF